MEHNSQEVLKEAIKLLQSELESPTIHQKHIVKTAGKLIQKPCTCSGDKSNYCGCQQRKFIAEAAEKEVKKL